MDQQNGQSQQVEYSSNDSSGTHKRHSFFHKKTNIIGVLALLIIVAAIPLTVRISQQRQSIEQQAATDQAFCSYDAWAGTPDWMKGNSGLGSEQLVYAPSDPEWNDGKSGWVKPGPPLEKGMPVGRYTFNKDGSEKQRIVLSGPFPVRYLATNDKIRGDFSGRTDSESAWSMFVRRMDDSYNGTYSTEIASRQISTGIVMKYEIMRIARDAIHEKTGGYSNPQEANQKIMNFEDTRSGEAQSISDYIGFDVTALIQNKELRKWEAGNDAQRKANMIMESAGCTTVPTVKPTSTTPISCAEKLMVPPVGFKVDFPSYTRNICDIPTNAAGKTELGVCGDYWTSGWCNNAGNATAQQNAVYACRGWSQTGTGAIDNRDRFMLYYTNRLHTMTDDEITANTTYEQRKHIWNSFMNEVKSGSIAFPYEHDNANKPREEVLNNALNAAATKIFGISWGQLKEQERMNNCPTIWDGAPTVAPTIPNGPTTGDAQITFTVDRSTVEYAQMAKLTWNVTNATSCTASGNYNNARPIGASWTGTKPLTGTHTEGPYGELGVYTYTLTCTGNNGGTNNKSLTVTVSAAGTLSPAPSVAPSTAPVTNGLNFTVTLHGIGAGGDNANASSANSNQSPKRTTRNAKIIFSDATDSETSRRELPTTITWDPATKKYKGSVDISNTPIATGNYTVKIKVDSYLTKRFGTSSIKVTSGQVTTLPEAQLVTGNANNDTALSVEDYNMLRDCVSVLNAPRACTPEKKLATDFNDDEKVDNVDYTLFVRELSVQQGD